MCAAEFSLPTPSFGVSDYRARCWVSLIWAERYMWGQDYVQVVVLSFIFAVFSLIHKNMIVVCQPNTHRHRANHRGGYNPWKLNFLIQNTFFFLLFCNNSSNEKENEITSRKRWSMAAIHPLGHVLRSPVSFIQAFTCTCMHAHAVFQMPHRYKQDGGCTAAKTLLSLSLMYSKLCASNESPPLTKAIV